MSGRHVRRTRLDPLPIGTVEAVIASTTCSHERVTLTFANRRVRWWCRRCRTVLGRHEEPIRGRHPGDPT